MIAIPLIKKNMRCGIESLIFLTDDIAQFIIKLHLINCATSFAFQSAPVTESVLIDAVSPASLPPLARVLFSNVNIDVRAAIDHIADVDHSDQCDPEEGIGQEYLGGVGEV